jgi:hypothetical protein
METASTLDRATLDALRESIAGVLAEQCGSTELHAFIDGKNALDKMLWAQAGQLGWLGLGIPEQFGGLGMGAQGLAILHGELGRQSSPGPYIATMSAAQTIVETGGQAICQTWLPRLASGDISAAVPAILDARPDPHWRPRFWHIALPGCRRRGIRSCSHRRWLGDRRHGQSRGDRGTDVGPDARRDRRPPEGRDARRNSARCGGDPRGADTSHGARRRCRQRRRCPFHYRTHHCLHEDARAIWSADRGIPGTETPRR